MDFGSNKLAKFYKRKVSNSVQFGSIEKLTKCTHFICLSHANTARIWVLIFSECRFNFNDSIDETIKWYNTYFNKGDIYNESVNQINKIIND